MAEDLKTKLKVIAELRAGVTTAKLCKKYAVHRNTICGWKKEVAAERGSLAPAITTAIELKTIDELAELGMPKKEALKILIEGMTKPEFTQFDGQGEQTIATVCKDYKTIRGYLQDYLKLIDAFPAEKSEVNIKAVVVNITDKLLAAMMKYVPADRRADLAVEVEGIFKEVQG
ncbi:hypothetical protein CCP3SC15_380016 [Gammaproteobacteria bacterium]